LQWLNYIKNHQIIYINNGVILSSEEQCIGNHWEGGMTIEIDKRAINNDEK